MKNVLIATDFSPAARSATRYGIKLAGALNIKVTLASAYESLPIPVTNDPVIVSPDDMEGLVREQLESEAKLFATPGLRPIEVRSCQGATTDALLDAVSATGADLIIAGMKEHGAAFRRIFGSTVTGLAKKTSKPLLIVPEGTDYSAPSSIVIANDLGTTAELHVPAFLRDLAASFHARITVVRFMGGRAAEVVEILDYSANFRRVTGVISPLEELPFRNDAEDRLMRYVEDQHCNLLAMPVHHQSLAERWLAANPSRHLILTTRLPFLLLPEDRA
ncbi:MAG TPA: universal stress protein [Puia sp.]|nr:universal stress protein [Puia sp.]